MGWIVALGLGTVACGGDDDAAGGTKTASDRIYVADEDSGSISVIEAETHEVVRSIALPSGAAMYMPHNVQAAPDGKSVWVSAPPMEMGGPPAPDKVFVIDPATDEIVSEIEVGEEQHLAHVILDPTSTKAYTTANEASTLIEIDAVTRAVGKTIDLGAGAGPHGARWCAGKIWIAAMTAKTLISVDPASSAVSSVDVGGVAVQTACTPDEKFVFVSLYDTKEVVRYELATQALVRIALPAEAQGPVQLYPSPDSKALWVCDQGILEGRPASNKLYRIDTAAATVAGSVDVGTGAHGVVVSQDGALAYVTNLQDNTVSAVDTAASTVIATIPVGQKPNGISHWHGNGGMP